MRRQKRTNSYHTLIIIVLIIVLAVIIFVVLANTKTDWKRTNGGQGFFRNMNENGDVIKSDCLKYSWDINTKGVSDIKIVSGADVREGEMHLWIEHNGDRVFDDCYAVGHSDMEYYWSGNDGIKLTLHAEMADIVIVTHDQKIADIADRILKIEDAKILDS